MLFAHWLKLVLHKGTLTIIDANSHRYRLGDGEKPAVTIRFHDSNLSWKLILNPEVKLLEAYVDGTMTIEEGTLYDLLSIATNNLETINASLAVRSLDFITRVLGWYPASSVRTSSRNIAHHYDLSHQLFEQFLDHDLQYTCAYFRDPAMTIDEAQEAKKLHIAAKLRIEPGMRILDLGCGWGGLCLYLAQVHDTLEVTGVTLSKEQHKVAQERALAQGVAQRVKFILSDYRQLSDSSYDRIVSVGLLEHLGYLGRRPYQTFFETIERLLNPSGIALVHSIGLFGSPRPISPWVRKYIFPGTYIPALSEVIPVIEKTNLWVTDIEILRLHYASTCYQWRMRFKQNRAQIRALYDEKFCRMWECYLIIGELMFRYGKSMVFHLQLSNRLNSVPIVRDYMTEWEATQLLHKKTQELNQE